MNRKYRLLIVDENSYVADILVQTLRNDFTVTVANTGQEAARLLIQGSRFDCVLTELNFPVFSGLELTKLIRTNWLISHIPVLVLSNAPDSDTRIKCLEEGVDTFIAKPFNPLEVKAKLYALLRRAAPPVEDVMRRSASVRMRSQTSLLWQIRTRVMSLLL